MESRPSGGSTTNCWNRRRNERRSQVSLTRVDCKTLGDHPIRNCRVTPAANPTDSLLLEKGLSIHVFSVFDCQHIKPFRTNETVENSIGPYSVGAYLLLLVSSLKRFAFQWVRGQIPESFFNFCERRRVEGLEVFLSLGREANFFHCSSPNTSLKGESFFALASFSPWSRASTV